MTEREWLTSTDVRKLTKFLPQPLSRRKCVLSVCGYGRRIESLVPLAEVVDYLHQAEEAADGNAPLESSFAQFQARFRPERHGLRINEAPNSICYALLWSLYTAAGERPYIGPANSQALRAAVAQLRNPDPTFSLGPKDHSKGWVRWFDVEATAQVDVVRDIFGNPFLRPVTLDPNWLTSTVLALARGIYEERAFDRMPILADALQDAGCENADVLDHCRGPGPHVRGCRVVDLVLGKS